MEVLTTTFLIPDWISAGLTGGLDERVGGVIREVGSKHVVAWLKEGFNPVGGSFLPTEDAYEQQYQERVVKTLRKKAQALGFDLVVKPTAPECVS